MAGIARGFLGEGIVRDDVLPFVRSADEEICLKTEALRSLRLQEAFQLGGGSPRRANNEIAARAQRPAVGDPELGEATAQAGRGALVVAADIDAPREADSSVHSGC